jgi:hypothetical protein
MNSLASTSVEAIYFYCGERNNPKNYLDYRIICVLNENKKSRR